MSDKLAATFHPGWSVAPHEVPAELEPSYIHADYPPKRVERVSIAEKLDSASVKELMRYAHGLGEPVL